MNKKTDKPRIECLDPEKEDDSHVAIFAVHKNSYIGKMARIEDLLAADVRIVAEIETFQTEIETHPEREKDNFFKKERERLSDKYELYGPYFKVLTAMMKGANPVYSLLAEVSVKNDDDDNFYIRMNNNITTKDMVLLYSKMLEFLDTTKNKPSNIMTPADDSHDVEIIKLNSGGKKAKEIADILDLTYYEVNQRLYLLKKKRESFKKS
jgi:hypothetical protein